MKMKKVLLLPVLAMLLSGCSGNGGGGGSSPSNPSTPISGDISDSSYHDPDKTLRLDFYLDYNHYDKENPYFVAWWYYDRAFTKQDLNLVDPDPTKLTDLDPFYPTFKGWSRHAVVDEDQYLWNFGTDKVSTTMAVGGYVEFFGIFTE